MTLRHRVGLALIIAYFAGVWNGATDSWWAVAGATVVLFLATLIALWGQPIGVVPRKGQDNA